MLLGFMLIIVYVYSRKLKEWHLEALYIIFISLLADSWSGLLYAFGTRLIVGFFVL